MNNIPRMYDSRAAVIATDSYEDGVPAGRMYLPQQNGEIAFYGILQALQEAEQVMDTIELPRSFGAMRTFQPLPPTAEPSESSGMSEGRLATFYLRVLFRQNASWQGSITWVEGRQEQSFRSVLELLLLVAGALSEAKSIPP